MKEGYDVYIQDCGDMLTKDDCNTEEEVGYRIKMT